MTPLRNWRSTLLRPQAVRGVPGLAVLLQQLPRLLCRVADGGRQAHEGAAGARRQGRAGEGGKPGASFGVFVYMICFALQVVEKVIARIDNPEKVRRNIPFF